MPIDHSPPRGNTANGESNTEGRATPTGMNLQIEYGRPDDPEAQAYAVRAVKTCNFWRDHPKTWFTQLEAKFRAHNVRSDELKFCVVVDKLDKESMLEIADIIEAPPINDKFRAIKEALISRLTDSDEKRLKKLFIDVELGDRKPTNLLRELRRLTGNAVNEQMLQALWLQRMPLRVQELLSVVEGVTLDKLAELADRTLERGSPGVTALTPSAPVASTAEQTMASAINELTQQVQRLVEGGRSRQQQRGGRNRSRNSSSSSRSSSSFKYCFYHSRFGKDARNCVQPCSWKKTFISKTADVSEN